MNVSDSERIASFLEARKYQKALKMESADIVIFNTCGIRQVAENRAYSTIHVLRKKQAQVKIVLTGCLANRKDVQKRLKDKVDLFCEIKDFPSQIPKVLDAKHRLSDISCGDSTYLNIKPKSESKNTALIPIMTGCNNFCSYCVVPYARGREWSRPDTEILDEIKNVLKNGAKEIILLGQNVNSYNSHGVNFPTLLQKIEKIPDYFWLRFLSSHPKDFSDELIETITKSEKICEHIHLPLQAGSNKILDKMNRNYTISYYLDLIEKIHTSFKSHKPNTFHSLSSDIIVGFPGETKNQFMESAHILEKVAYDMVYFGQFSPRPGTVAWEMKDNVTQAEKIRREKVLNEILAKTVFANNQKYLHKNLEVLITEEKNGSYFGRTRTMKNVKISTDEENLIGKFVNVKITKTNIWNLEATLLERQKELIK